MNTEGVQKEKVYARVAKGQGRMDGFVSQKRSSRQLASRFSLRNAFTCRACGHLNFGGQR